MKKMIVLLMALTFGLGITALAFAADDKPVAGPGVPSTIPPTISAEEKAQLADTKKKSTAKPKPTVKDSGAATLGPEEKAQIADTKKKATKKQVAPKEGAGLPATLGPEEKQDIEEAKKKSTAEKRKEKRMKKEAAPEAPAEKK